MKRVGGVFLFPVLHPVSKGLPTLLAAVLQRRHTPLGLFLECLRLLLRSFLARLGYIERVKRPVLCDARREVKVVSGKGSEDGEVNCSWVLRSSEVKRGSSGSLHPLHSVVCSEQYFTVPASRTRCL